MAVEKSQHMVAPVDAADYTVDRSGWAPGPWDGEPDRLELDAHGLPGLALRHPTLGFWCGYVGIPREHRYYGLHYRTLAQVGLGLGVHGGLTYADDRVYVVWPGEPRRDQFVGRWWLGFDCGHALDLAPGFIAQMVGYMTSEMRTRLFIEGHIYRDLEFVKGQIALLAQQLA